MIAGQEINFPGRVAGWPGGRGGIGNKAQLRPAKAGAGAWPELGNNQTLFLYLRFASLNSDTLRSLTAAPQSDLNLDY